MIALLSGHLACKSFDHVIVDVGGVGYRLLIPLSTYYALPDNGNVRLHVHTHVREDAIHLFGFLTTAEKELFGQLLSVSGVGPKLAINILSHIPAETCGRRWPVATLNGSPPCRGSARKPPSAWCWSSRRRS
jgi:holliday junction DNA helicase RuvA